MANDVFCRVLDHPKGETGGRNTKRPGEVKEVRNAPPESRVGIEQVLGGSSGDEKHQHIY